MSHHCAAVQSPTYSVAVRLAIKRAIRDRKASQCVGRMIAIIGVMVFIK